MRVWLTAALLAATTSAAPAAEVLVEAESFADRGGWVVDQQFMDQMGSPMLLAHGMGVTVKDASTTLKLPKAGNYRVWVRTRDWVAPLSPGEFGLAIDGVELQQTFGTNGAAWAWQDGGTLDIKGVAATLTLKDKTGFEGRCDAICLSDDLKFVPPNDAKELAAWRKKALGLPAVAPTAGKYDLVVVGGGIAGTCAAVAGARHGLSVALIQDRPVLGGNASGEIRVRPEGKAGGPYPKIADVVNEVTGGFKGGNTSPAAVEGDQARLKLVQNEKNIALYLNMHAFAVEKDGNRIKAVLASDVITSKELRFEGRVFADCTGDATIGFLAGAEFRQGREGKSETEEKTAPEKPDAQTMGTSNMWYARERAEESKFPETPWALPFNESTVARVTAGGWDWESGMRWDTIADAEKIRDHNFRAIYGNWSFLKNTYPEKYAKWQLDWVAYVAGKRESRRLLGDVILKLQDFQDKRQFDDGVVQTGWKIDVHEPVGPKDFAGQEFRSKVGPAPNVPMLAIPYRCLYSRNVDNLMMAGRNISVTHVALGSVRVQKTTGMMGVVVAKAAVVCKRHEAAPRGVYQKHWPEMKELLDK